MAKFCVKGCPLKTRQNYKINNKLLHYPKTFEIHKKVRKQFVPKRDRNNKMIFRFKLKQ